MTKRVGGYDSLGSAAMNAAYQGHAHNYAHNAQNAYAGAANSYGHAGSYVPTAEPQESGMKCWTAFWIGYIAAGFLTFAWVHETEWSERMRAERADQIAFGSFVAGSVWPLYWASRGSLATVRYVRARTPSPMCKDATGNVWAPTAEGFCIAKAQP